jgi:hypothetical protein
MSRKKEKSRPADWLIGTWRSDKERTVAAWGKSPPGSPAFQKILLRDLGKLTLKYTAKRSWSSFDGDASSEPYRVVWQSSSSVFVVSGRKRSESGQLVSFESPSVYWVHVGKFVEFFSKVQEPNNALKRTRENPHAA